MFARTVTRWAVSSRSHCRFSSSARTFVFGTKTAYEIRIRDWSSDVCSSDLCWSENAYEHVGALQVGRNIDSVNADEHAFEVYFARNDCTQLTFYEFVHA